MSFSDAEISNYDGKPVMLYEFERDGTYWRYAESDEDVVAAGVAYSSLVAESSGITQSGDTTQDEFTIKVPIDLEIVQMYLRLSPSTKLNVRIRRWQRDIDAAAIVWVGRLDRVKVEDDATASVVCRNALASLEGEGLRLTWGRGCPHMLYDGQCRVNRDDFKVTGEVTAKTGNSITCDAFDTPQFGVLYGGFVEWTSTDGFIERRPIVGHNNSTLTVLVRGSLATLNVGDTISAFYGCARTPTVCQEVFNNLPNYGGFPCLPGKSPFDGNPVF